MPSSTRTSFGASAALVALTVLSFAPALRHGFLLYEDPVYVTGNEVVRQGWTGAGLAWAFTTFHGANWFPLTWLSHMTDWEWFGNRPAFHHGTGLLLHAASAALAYLWLSSATGRRAAALLAATLWAVHPLRAESAAWVSSRKDVLCGVFFFLALLAWDRWVKTSGRGSYASSVGFFVLALLSKSTAMVFPVLLLVLDGWPYRRSRHGPWLREKVPFFLLAAASAAVTWLAQSRGGATVDWSASGPGSRLANAVVSLAAYLRDTAWPTALAVHHPYVPDVPAPRWVLAVLLLAGITAALWRMRERAPWALAGWVWFLVAVAPTSGIVQIGAHARADRFTYLPFVGLAWTAAWAWDAVAGRRRTPAVAAAGAVVLVLCAASWTETRRWRDDETLFRRALEVHPGASMSQFNLANALRRGAGGREANPREAEALYREAVRGKPRFAEAHFNLANLLSDTGRVEEATGHYRQAVAARPDDARFRNNLGVALAQSGRREEAVEQFRAALTLDPLFSEARGNLERATGGRDDGGGERPPGGG